MAAYECFLARTPVLLLASYDCSTGAVLVLLVLVLVRVLSLLELLLRLE